MLSLFLLVIGLLCVNGFHEDGIPCLYRGKIYEHNEVINSNPCNPLKCMNGYVPRLIIDCPNAPCVDYEVKPGDCCASCPTGPNCRLPDGSIIPEDQPRTLDDGRVCKCQYMFGFGLAPRNPNAVCQ